LIGTPHCNRQSTTNEMVLASHSSFFMLRRGWWVPYGECG
jgi:hypothetical protein